MDNPKGEMPFLDHLEELRWRILWSLLAVVVGSAAGVWAVMHFGVVDVLTAPLYKQVSALRAEHPELAAALGDGRLEFLGLTGPFFFKMKLGLIVGVLLASPIVIYQMWRFFAPALEPHERRVIVPSFTLGLVLFAAGVATAYFAALPISIRVFLTVGVTDFDAALTADYYMPFVIRLLITFGLVFEVPVVVMVLAFLGLVTPAFLRAKRRHAIVAMLVLAAAASPGDIVSLMALLLVPMVLLYELSIVLATLVRRERIDTTPLLIPMIAIYEARRALLGRRLATGRAA